MKAWTSPFSAVLRKRQVLALIIFVLNATSCTGVDAREQAFAQLLVSDDTNKSVTLAPYVSEASAAEGTYVAVEVRNNSDAYVSFPPGYGPRAFMWQDDTQEWLEVGNEVIFPDVDFQLGPAGGEVPYLGIGDFASRDQRLLLAEWVRILVEGARVVGDTGGEGAFSAFVDVTIP